MYFISSAIFFLAPLFGWMGQPPTGPIPAADSGAQRTRGEDNTCLFLNGGRFQTSLTWKRGSQDEFRSAQGVVLENETGFDETAYFWFEDPANIDVIVRVFNGCQFNDNFWVFYGSLTDAAFDIQVTDIETGLEKIFTHSGFKIGKPIQDTDAFATCTRIEKERRQTAEPPLPARKMEETLSLHDGRFLVDLDWHIPGQPAGKGTVGLATATSGAFWFLDRSDLNVFLKIIDGRPINGHYWLSFTSLTGAEYSMRVTDTQTGVVRTYTNPLEESRFGTDYLLDTEGDQELLYPWVSDNERFDSIFIANNSNCLPTDVVLEAQRGDGQTATAERTIPPLGFLEETATELFPELSGGSGYAVHLSSPSPGVLGRWVTNNRDTPSMNSPSQGVAVQLPSASADPSAPNAGTGKAIHFGYLPNQPNFFTGTVVVNVGDAATDLTLYFYDKQGRLINSDDNLGRGLVPFRPLATISRDLLPGAANDSFAMVAYSPDQPLAGVIFVFNQDGEPAIGNAGPINFVPPPR